MPDDLISPGRVKATKVRLALSAKGLIVWLQRSVAAISVSLHQPGISALTSASPTTSSAAPGVSNGGKGSEQKVTYRKGTPKPAPGRWRSCYLLASHHPCGTLTSTHTLHGSWSKLLEQW